MDDDIRDRFRGVSRSGPVPNSYGRQGRPMRPIPKPAPRPVAPKPPWPPAANPQPRMEARPAPSTPASPEPIKRPKPLKRRKKRGKRSKKLFLVVLVLLFLAAASGGGYVLYNKYIRHSANNKPQTQPVPAAAQTLAPKPTGTIRFIAIGDNLAFDTINSVAKKPDGNYDYLPMLAGLKPYFDKADIRLCNESTPGGGDKNGLAFSGYPSFNAPLEWSIGFASLGCNVINLASDHINDKGQPAIDATLGTWNGQKNVLAIAGANRTAEDQAKIAYFTVKQVKFAYLAYTTGTANKPANAFAVNVYSDDLANKQIAEAHKNAQLVIVSMNWGTENSADINADQERIAANLAAQNVDVIVGGGPHVVQPAKILSGKEGHQTLAWFSLGNFLNSELAVDNLIGGMAIMDFDVATQTIANPKLMPVYMHYEWTAAQKAANTVNARHDLKLMPLDVAAPFLAKSLNGTTVEAQTSRVTGIISKFAPIKVIKSTEF